MCLYAAVIAVLECGEKTDSVKHELALLNSTAQELMVVLMESPGTVLGEPMKRIRFFGDARHELRGCSSGCTSFGSLSLSCCRNITDDDPERSFEPV